MQVIPTTDRLSPLRAVCRFALPLALAAALVACDRKPQQQGQAPPPPAVTVAKPVKRTIVDQDEYVGRFAAVNSVEVRARVSGYLDGVHFKDGQMVKQGDLLFTIDKRPFQNGLRQAEAVLTQAKTNLVYAESDFNRGQQLVREKTITEQSFEQRSQAARNARAAVAGAEAALRQAQLDLEFTEPRAPIAGRIGDRRVSPGNLVTGGNSGNTTLLATIVSTDPIHFEFTFDEASFLRYQRMAKNGHDIASRSAGTEVRLRLIDEQKFMHEGRMDFVDNVIDRSTGTIRGRAVLANPNGLFTPGMFARVQVPGSPPYEALLVPDVAIGSEQSRKFVLVVDGENIARAKYVTLGPLDGDLRVIKSGLEANDSVIINGIARVRPSQKVTPQQQGAPNAAGPGPQAGGDKPAAPQPAKTN